MRSQGYFAAAAAALAATPTFAQWSLLNWKVEEIGLYDSEHRAPDGSYFSWPVATSAGGMVIGMAKRFVTGYDLDRSAWVWLPDGGTTQIRFEDALHVAPDGTRYSIPRDVNSRGEVVGESRHYFSQTSSGQSAWYWSPQTGIMRIGLLDDVHTQSTGVQISAVRHISDAGVALGYSYRYNDIDGQIGLTPWVWTLEHGTIPIGLTDEEHTSSTGSRIGFGLYANRNGSVAGWSYQFFDQVPFGRSGWVWSRETGTVKLNAEPFNEDETTLENVSFTYGINAAGEVIGISQGISSPLCWLYSDRYGYVPVGLNDVVHQSPSGFRSMTPLLISDSRWVAGTAMRTQRYPEYDDGTSGWVWNEQLGAFRIGQVNANQSNEARDFSKPLFLHESGRVYGITALGSSSDEGEAWTWSPESQTIEIGFIGTYHPAGSDYRNVIHSMNSVGQAIGLGYLTKNPQEDQSAWFFDPQSGQTYLMNSSGPNGGPTWSTPLGLTDEGVMIGVYQTVQPGQPRAGGAFVWSRERGFKDLALCLGPALAEAGFSPSGLSVYGFAGNRRIAGTVSRVGFPGNRAAVAIFSPPYRCPGDANFDRTVSFADLTSVLERWGGTSPPDAVQGDANSDGAVSILDITAVLEFWGNPCLSRSNRHADSNSSNEP